MLKDQNILVHLSEILYDISRTRIKRIADVIESKLRDPKIKKVICYGHSNADLDAIGSSLGIWALAKEYNKEAYICSVTQDSTTEAKQLKKLFLKMKRFLLNLK